MPQINKLSATDSITGSDLFPVYTQQSGDARKASANVLLDFIKANMGAAGYVEQALVVSADNFNTQVASNGNNIWLILNLISDYATGAITLPPLAEVVDGQQVLVFNSRQVTNFSVNGNGAVAVHGAPTSLSADSSFTLRFSNSSNSWYKVA